MKTQDVNIETGEIVIRDMTPEEIETFHALAQAEIEGNLVVKAKLLAQFNEQILLQTLLQVFIGYLGQFMQGNLPVVTFADFMGQVFQGYLANGGQVNATPPPENKPQEEKV